MAAVTPMLKQYEAIKAQYPDCILFFRLGDFYEMFGEDAETGSRALEIVLTSRDSGNGNKIPMCGVPYHAVDNYLARLIQKGYKVAICEQIEDPKLAKGLVERDVIRVVTPGTVLENQILNATANNYLMAVWREKFLYGIAFTDISTGEFCCTEINTAAGTDTLFDEIMRVAPVECVLTKELYNDELFSYRLKSCGLKSCVQAQNEKFVAANAVSLLKTQYKLASLDALGIAGHPCAINACALILDFLQSTQKKNLQHLKYTQFYTTDLFMYIDANTQRNLELIKTMRNGEKQGSLLWVLDHTQTAMGARMLKEWLLKPLLDSAAIYFRQEGVAELVAQQHIRRSISDMLAGVYDMERLLGRVSGGNATVRDLLSLKQSLQKLPDIFKQLSRLHAPVFSVFVDNFDLMTDIAELLEMAVNEDDDVDGDIRQGYNAEVDELRHLSRDAKDFLRQMEIDEKQKTGIRNLKISYNKVFGYYIEVSNSNLELVPQHYIRKQTLVNGERFITPELKEYEDKILNAAERLERLEAALMEEVRGKVFANRTRIQGMAMIIATLDVLQSLAQCAFENDYACPVVDDGNVIDITEGRHPVIEKIIGREHFVPNDCHLDSDGEQLRIITGPNMCGKSTYMRQVALITLLAKIGSFVPAQSAHIGACDRIFTRVGASDDLSAGQSTFMVEMCEAANILHNATEKSLVILDEIGRGTSTFDGLSIAWSIAETIIQPQIKAKTLFATHYHELTELENMYPQIKNYSVAVREKDGNIIFLRKIVRGGTDKSYGIHVAALAGLPYATIKRAEELLRQLESEKGKELDIEAATAETFKHKPDISDPVLQELKELDLNMLSPMAALMKLAEWQQKLNN